MTAAGLSVWLDKARLRPGCDWHKEIEAGCEARRLVLPVLTPRWKESEWTKFETYGAEATIPLIFKGTLAEIFTPPLTRFQGLAIDLARRDETAWHRLIEAVRESLARPAPDKLARLAEVRYAANPYFIGREAELIQIHEALHENPTAVLTQGRVRAITALGGIGKTTLAREYIEKFWRCYPQIFWTDCRLGVETEFARLCEVLFPETRDATDAGKKARLALRELQTRSDRLLILDNAEDEASIQAWIPKTGHCRTLSKLAPPARAILRLSAFLAPTPLPLTVLIGGSQVLLDESAAVAGSPVSPPNHIEAWVRKHVGQLWDYSMVDGEGQSISLHPLVQTVQRLTLSTSPGEHRATLERSLHWINAAFVGNPQDVRTWPTLNPLVPHATAVLQHADQDAIAEPTARLMHQLGLLLWEKARHTEAEPLMRRELAIEEQSYGSEHPEIAKGLNNLSMLLRDMNRPAEAEPLIRRALAIDEQSYGAEHPNVARDLNNLVLLLHDTNRLAEAEPLMRRALAIVLGFKGSAGNEHPHLRGVRGNYAALLKAMGRSQSDVDAALQNVFV